MPRPLLRNFQRFEDADAARSHLLAAGLAAASVQLRVLDDEAGPVEGNFLVGNGRREDGSKRPPPADGMLVGPAVPYQTNFTRPVARGAHLLVVEPADEAERARAEAILNRVDAIDVDAASRGTG